VDILNSLVCKRDEISQSTEPIVFYSLATLEEDECRVTTKLDVLAQLTLKLTIDLSNTEFPLHFSRELCPCSSHVLAVRTPGRVKLDEPALGRGL
jgi:hypothetical protein